MATGTVKWFKDTYGFIEQDGGADVFVHFSAITNDGYRTLRQGQRVSFEVAESPKGPRAANVTILEES